MAGRLGSLVPAFPIAATDGGEVEACREGGAAQDERIDSRRPDRAPLRWKEV